MKTYKLVKYFWDELIDVLEHDDLKFVENEAIRLSKEEKDLMFRIDPYLDGQMQLGLRYFKEGKELTQEFRQAILGTILNEETA